MCGHACMRARVCVCVCRRGQVIQSSAGLAAAAGGCAAAAGARGTWAQAGLLGRKAPRSMGHGCMTSLLLARPAGANAQLAAPTSLACCVHQGAYRYWEPAARSMLRAQRGWRGSGGSPPRSYRAASALPAPPSAAPQAPAPGAAAAGRTVGWPRCNPRLRDRHK